MSEDTQVDLAGVMQQIAEELKHTVMLEEGALATPLQVKSARFLSPSASSRFPVGSFVACRLAGGDKKTYLGIFLGEFPIELFAAINTESGELSVSSMTNPAMFLPDLGRVVFGCESWWSPIASEADLQQISDQDIENVWYVKALKSFAAAESEPSR